MLGLATSLTEAMEREKTAPGRMPRMREAEERRAAIVAQFPNVAAGESAWDPGGGGQSFADCGRDS